MQQQKTFWQATGRYLLLSLLFAVMGVLVLVLVLKPVLEPFAPALNTMPGDELRFGAVTSVQRRFPVQEEVPLQGTADLDALGWPVVGEVIGNVQVEGTVVNCELFYGDGPTELHYGAGIYAGAQIPGQGSTVMVAGHTGTFFRDFESAELGATVTLETYYGTYTYEITDMQVVDENDSSAYDLEKPEENLIMYTCYPFNELGYTPYRYFIYAKYISGPTVIGAPDAA